MPVYNGLPHLTPAIESVLAQTYGDFEFLIVNDASTDESLACIRSYQDPRIRLVENPTNLGTSRTMNRGIELATGAYIARLDQDDVSMPRRLEVQLAYMEARPHLDITCTWEHGLDSDGRLIREWRTSVDDDGGFLGPLLMGICPIWHPSIMFKRQALIDAGGFDPTMQPGEDFEVTMRLALKGYHAGVVPEFLVGQRDHNARQSVTKAAAQARRTQELHESMLRRFTADGDVERLGQLLRFEDAWRRGGLRKGDVAALLVTLDNVLSRIRADHALSDAAADTLRHVVYRRLGPGARLAPRWRSLPAPVFFGLLFAMSPLLIPGVRPLASSLFAKLHRVSAQVRN
jgi:glycosyltransferase involved in cell wall biosynthesis